MATVSVLLGIAVTAFVVTLLRLLNREKIYKNEIEAARKKTPLSVSAEEILHDLSRGPALIRIDRIDPGSVFLRSPRA